MLVLGFFLLCFVFFPAAVYLLDKEGKTDGSSFLKFPLLIGGILFMGGVLFKVQHWPGSAILLQAGWALLILVFLPLFLVSRLKAAGSRKEKNILILGTISLFIFSLSALMKIFHWPGAGPCIIVGSVLLVAVFLPLYTKNKISKGLISGGQFLYMITLTMFGVVLIALISLNVSKNVLKNFEKQESDSFMIAQYFKAKKKIAPGSLSEQSKEKIDDISARAHKINDLIWKIKLDLVQNADKADRARAANALFNSSQINNKDNNQSGKVLLDDKTSGRELREELESFRETAAGYSDNDPVFSGNIRRLLNTDTYSPNEITWEEMNFRNYILIGTLSLLSDMERDVRITEIQVIQHLSNSKL